MLNTACRWDKEMVIRKQTIHPPPPRSGRGFREMALKATINDKVIKSGTARHGKEFLKKVIFNLRLENNLTFS